MDSTIAVRIVGHSDDSQGLQEPLERLVRALPLPENSQVLAGPPGLSCPHGFLQFAQEAMTQDPRVATVSWADSAIAHLSKGRGRNRLAAPLPRPYGHAHAQLPAGDLIVINHSLFDLIGVPIGEGGTVSLRSIRDWSRRANHRGLRHVWWWSGETSENDPVLLPSDFDEREARDPSGALGLLVDQHRAQFDALSIGVDASWLGDNETGAQVALVQWLHALAQRTDIAEIRLFNLPSDRLPNYAVGLSGNPAIRIVPQGSEPGEAADVFWRPSQPDHRTVMDRDRRLGRRLVTTILDLIEYANERYHTDHETWAQNRNRTRVYMSRVDLVTGISRDVVEHLTAEIPGMEPQRVRVTSLGVGHLAGARHSAAPYDLRRVWPSAGEGPFLLVLGNDYMHKNRDFAIRVWHEVAQQRRVDLVLAGLHVHGSSTRAVEETLLHAPYVDGSRAIRLAHTSTAAKTWLLSNATLLLYPSSAEGFGFVPHEAASLGVPSVSTRFGPLKEFLPAQATIEQWSIAGYTERVLKLIDDSQARQDQIMAFGGVRDSNSWEQAAEQLAGAFRDALRFPPRMPVTASSGLAADLGGASDVDEAALVQALTQSLSWRVTKPLRATAAQARRVKRRLR